VLASGGRGGFDKGAGAMGRRERREVLTVILRSAQDDKGAVFGLTGRSSPRWSRSVAARVVLAKQARVAAIPAPRGSRNPAGRRARSRTCIMKPSVAPMVNHFLHPRRQFWVGVPLMVLRPALVAQVELPQGFGFSSRMIFMMPSKNAL